MTLKPIPCRPERYPESLLPFLSGAQLYDSSSSSNARVIYIQKDSGYFLKSALKGTLQQEAALTAWFHKKGLAADVIAYISCDKDWMLTEKLPGNDCVSDKYLSDPARLCDVLSQLLWSLHHMDYTGCPVGNHTELYLERAAFNYRKGKYDNTLFPNNWGYASAGKAYDVLSQKGHLLCADTLLHGDFCLPNIILRDWKLSGFVDLDSGGVGDRHVDLFWALWTLQYNLKTDQYRQRFTDGYGRASVEEDFLQVIGAAEVFG